MNNIFVTARNPAYTLDDCLYCGKKISRPNMKRHENACYLNPNNKKLCPVCNKYIKAFKENKTCSSLCARVYFGEEYRFHGRKGKKLSYRTICFDFHEKKCIICAEKNIVEVHHFDEDHKNDHPTNLIPLCPTHHVYQRSFYDHISILNFRGKKTSVRVEINEYQKKFDKKYQYLLQKGEINLIRPKIIKI